MRYMSDQLKWQDLKQDLSRAGIACSQHDSTDGRMSCSQHSIMASHEPPLQEETKTGGVAHRGGQQGGAAAIKVQLAGQPGAGPALLEVGLCSTLCCGSAGARLPRTAPLLLDAARGGRLPGRRAALVAGLHSTTSVGCLHGFDKDAGHKLGGSMPMAPGCSHMSWPWWQRCIVGVAEHPERVHADGSMQSVAAAAAAAAAAQASVYYLLRLALAGSRSSSSRSLLAFLRQAPLIGVCVFIIAMLARPAQAISQSRGVAKQLQAGMHGLRRSDRSASAGIFPA